MTEPLLMPSGAHIKLAPPLVPVIDLDSISTVPEVRPGVPEPPMMDAEKLVPATVLYLPVTGPRGQQGTPGSGALAVGEALIGVQDGVNATFSTESDFQPQTTAVYRNGLREMLGYGYDEIGTSMIVFDEAPFADDHICVDYQVQ